jgi:hypothetical protein
MVAPRPARLGPCPTHRREGFLDPRPAHPREACLDRNELTWIHAHLMDV